MLYFGRGHQVCCVAWQAVYGITKKTLSKAWKTVKSDVCQIEPQTSSLRSKKTDAAVTWIKLFVQHVGNRMPDGHSLDSRKLERVQVKGLRVVYCNKSATYEELLRTA